MVLCPISAKCQTPPPAPNILVLYDNSGEFAWLGKMYSLKLQNLLSHFDAKVTRKPLGQYVAGDVALYDASFYIGSTWSETALPARIKTDLDEARQLRDEARALLETYEAKQREVAEQSARIVATAKGEAEAAAAQAKVDLKASIARRMTAAADQIDSSVKAAERAVRDQALSVSVAVAADVLKRQMTAAQANAAIDASIEQVAAKLH